MSTPPGVGPQRQTEIYLDGIRGRRPTIPFDPGKLERMARSRMTAQAFAEQFKREVGVNAALVKAVGLESN